MSLIGSLLTMLVVSCLFLQFLVCLQMRILSLDIYKFIYCFVQTLILPPACFLSIVRRKVTPTQVNLLSNSVFILVSHKNIVSSVLRRFINNVLVGFFVDDVVCINHHSRSNIFNHWLIFSSLQDR